MIVSRAWNSAPTITWSSPLPLPSCWRGAYPAAARRRPVNRNDTQIADLDLDLARRRVTRAGHRLHLTVKEFALLELLMRRQGEVLPCSLITSQVWDMNFDSDTNVIDVAIRRLRAKIDDGFDLKLIHTVRGMGYMLDASGEP